ncbi:MAG TPA: helix-turn-helix transcriptional regulator [Dehalococcoidia bacterium]|nr:helix-turn-helix transcriptional regulator [Dehalococcoidia bacterium]
MTTHQAGQRQSRPGVLPPFGQLLKRWRERRRMSQLDLAGEADISARHLSFVETGRSQPSRDTILCLCRALEIPPRSRNELLTAAGYAPIYRETPLEAPELAQVRRALDYFLRQQEPYPAMLVDRHWNILQSNDAMSRVMGRFPDPADLAALGAPNAMRLTHHPRGLRPFIRNWEAAAAISLQWLQRDVWQTGDRETRQLLDELLTYPGVPPDWRTLDLERAPAPFLAIELEKDDLRLSFFTVLAGLGTPYDITLDELRIECFFPADHRTDEFFHRLAAQELP